MTADSPPQPEGSQSPVKEARVLRRSLNEAARVLAWFPILSQCMSAVQALTGDMEGARQTQVDFSQKGPVIGHMRALVERGLGGKKAADETWDVATRLAYGLATATPVLGHGIGVVHYIQGHHADGDQCMINASRATASIATSIAAAPLGPIAPVAVLCARAAYDGAATLVKSAVGKKYAGVGLGEVVGKAAAGTATVEDWTRTGCTQALVAASAGVHAEIYHHTVAEHAHAHEIEMQAHKAAVDAAKAAEEKAHHEQAANEQLVHNLQTGLAVAGAVVTVVTVAAQFLAPVTAGASEAVAVGVDAAEGTAMAADGAAAAAAVGAEAGLEAAAVAATEAASVAEGVLAAAVEPAAVEAGMQAAAIEGLGVGAIESAGVNFGVEAEGVGGNAAMHGVVEEGAAAGEGGQAAAAEGAVEDGSVGTQTEPSTSSSSTQTEVINQVEDGAAHPRPATSENATQVKTKEMEETSPEESWQKEVVRRAPQERTAATPGRSTQTDGVEGRPACADKEVQAGPSQVPRRGYAQTQTFNPTKLKSVDEIPRNSQAPQQTLHIIDRLDTRGKPVNPQIHIHEVPKREGGTTLIAHEKLVVRGKEPVLTGISSEEASWMLEFARKL